ncbi:bifunctional diaminohydroxyphosphoribosylaminopyrimidine deaminase/5-amino-6-(5-phosphoribosylamino)uracil reductase RibD [Ahrensia kielensis]|uniref:bifunctional diaminohydroxyphosphoribosylaminopyrimidine deaminase/5-amino-6-(5-phosphoribosylamino)uracil reductase RibD n=1 Tax=Ahrensia kielensis TaxID=76980 RepID=UPI00035E58F4|nr:bifunctional diaminohydroxyphosphoribosylaminopyrimidine deaminase/5-amino-6-(5-phosphoribosylamino)uracil reductase RibD [Ahrensia kielensis]
MAAENLTKTDERFMAAAIRLGRRHLARTGTNPSVSTLLVKDLGHGPVIVGSGITDIGGRPHAEAAALAEAGEHAKGATAYVTLEPCAHHGRTPPCAVSLVNAGITRLVSALTDPDERVSGKGYNILREAGITVLVGCLEDEARTVLGSYLNRSMTKRAQATLKLAVSADGMIGDRKIRQLMITQEQARHQSHILRAEHDAIIVGVDTAIIDNPTLTCRLPGLENRSPARIVLDTGARLGVDGALVHTIDQAPLYVATAYPQSDNAKALADHGAKIMACDIHDGRIALPELMEDLAAIGITRALVEGGGQVARSFLRDDLVENICLFESDVEVGKSGIASPVTSGDLPDGFVIKRRAIFGPDRYFEIGKN